MPYYGYGYYVDERAIAARQRANNIRDNFGVEAMSVDEYRKESGGKRVLFGLLTAALAIGAVAAAYTGGMALMIGLLAGAVVTSFASSSENRKTLAGYNNYLDGVAARARAGHEQGMSQTVEYDNGNGRKSYTADLAQQQATAYAGTNR